MTPYMVARRKAARWFYLAVAAVAVKSALEAVGITLVALPLEILAIWAAMVAGPAAGWAAGYRARDEADR